MGGKHLKKLRAEKSKIHFKKRALRKDQNLTNTTFTVKKILTVEQLKKVDENEPVSNWKLPLKDLLIRLNHYNVTSRLNGLLGIKELLNKHPEILKGPSLQSLLSRLLELITDEEPKVRSATSDLLAYLFNLIPPASVIPFYDIFSVHLGCAMTHRNAFVQQDSLKLIDIMMKYMPKAIKNNFKTITENFLRIIKNYLYEAHSEIVNHKQPVGKTKTKMLHRFYKFLVIGCSNTKDEEQSDQKNKNITILTEQKTSLRNLSDNYKNIPDLSLLFKCCEDKHKILIDFDLNEFQSLCSCIIPMLFKTWLEFLPNQISSECIVTEEIGELLLVILEILLLLYSKTAELKDEKMVAWFVSSYSLMFQDSFTSNFPYLPLVSLKESNSSSSNALSRGSNIFVAQNLFICYLSYLLKIVQKNSSIESKMENYISDVLMMTNPTEIEILSKVLGVVISTSNHKISNAILSKMVEAYKATRNLELRQSLSMALMKIVLSENNGERLKEKSIVDFIKSLPNRLCESQIFIQELETILKLINRPAGVEIVKKVEYKAEKIIMNLPVIKIHGIIQLEGQKMIANILYRCSNKMLEQIIQKNLLNLLHSEELRQYTKNIFSQKLKESIRIISNVMN